MRPRAILARERTRCCAPNYSLPCPFKPLSASSSRTFSKNCEVLAGTGAPAASKLVSMQPGNRTTSPSTCGSAGSQNNQPVVNSPQDPA
jgi:hypothetical protein